MKHAAKFYDVQQH